MTQARQDGISLKQWLPLIGLACCAFVFNTSEFMPIGLLTDIAASFSLTEAQALKGNFPADTESIGALYIRATQFLRYLFEHHDNQRVLAVGHGLFNRCILATLACQNIRDIPRMHNAEVRSVTLDRLPAHLLSDEDEIATD